MKRRVFCFGGITSLLAAGCGPGPECLSSDTGYVYSILTNKSPEPISRTYGGFKTLSPGQWASAYLHVLDSSGCGLPPIPPSASSVATNMWLLHKATSTPDQGKVLFGGPLATYQEWKDRDPTSDLAKATLHSHSLFFVPGSQVRQDMGLVVNNPTGTEIFTSLDPWRPYKFEGFTLNIDVYDLDAGDIRMSVTGTLAN